MQYILPSTSNSSLSRITKPIFYIGRPTAYKDKIIIAKPGTRVQDIH